MSSDFADLSDQFLRFLQRSESEVSDNLIKEHFGSRYHELSGCINELLSQNRIVILKDDTQLFYRAVREETAEKFQGLSADQMLVYQVCERAGNKGVWTRDIKIATNVQQQSLTKTLKMLSDRNLIKSVRSVISKSKKLYMLYDVEPAKEVTGGPWYTEQEFDHEFIEELCNFIVRYVNDKGITNVNDINDRVRISGISKVELTIEELEQVLQILVYDGRLEEVLGSVLALTGLRGTSYKVSKAIKIPNYLTEMPCGKCPVISQCIDGGIISPTTCLYLTKWLSLDDETPEAMSW